jgi:hypothetical protein
MCVCERLGALWHLNIKIHEIIKILPLGLHQGWYQEKNHMKKTKNVIQLHDVWRQKPMWNITTPTYKKLTFREKKIYNVNAQSDFFAIMIKNI